MSVQVDVASQLQALRDRGVTDPAAHAHLGADVLAETVKWFDAQQGRVGAGVLVQELRSGGRRAEVRRVASLTEREAEYARQVVGAIRREFPELCDPNPHPAAVTAVIRLHHVEGRVKLDNALHTSLINAAVKAWDERFGPDAEMVA